MNASRSPRRSTKDGSRLCVYCHGPANTQDHAPPRCLFRKPRPSNLITLPACRACNSGFSFHESLVKALLAITTSNPDFAIERERVARSLARDKRLRSTIDSARRPDGNYELSGPILDSVERVMRKTAQGLFFGLYDRLLSARDIQLQFVSDQRFITPEQLVDEIRPGSLRDITDQPLPAITPSCWMVREPVFFVKFGNPNLGFVERIFRLVRETPIDWVDFQRGVVRFAFIKSDARTAVCVLDLWKTLVVSLKAPWPARRGPLRRGKRNPLSRDGK
jgi:hypothetical protein